MRKPKSRLPPSALKAPPRSVMKPPPVPAAMKPPPVNAAPKAPPAGEAPRPRRPARVPDAGDVGDLFAIFRDIPWAARPRGRVHARTLARRLRRS
jgi:hypothetical protein